MCLSAPARGKTLVTVCKQGAISPTLLHTENWAPSFFSLSLIRILMAAKAAPPSVISHATEFLIGPLCSEERLRGFQTMASQLHGVLWENKQCKRGGGKKKKTWCIKKSIEWVSCVSRWSCSNDSDLTVSAKTWEYLQQQNDIWAKQRGRKRWKSGKTLGSGTPLERYILCIPVARACARTLAHSGAFDLTISLHPTIRSQYCAERLQIQKELVIFDDRTCFPHWSPPPPSPHSLWMITAAVTRKPERRRWYRKVAKPWQTPSVADFQRFPEKRDCKARIMLTAGAVAIHMGGEVAEAGWWNFLALQG